MRQSSGRSAAVLAHWNPSASEEQLRTFYQDRLALFSKSIGWVFGILMVLINLMYLAEPSTRPRNADIVNILAIPSLVAVLLLWLRLRRGRPGLGGLFVLDISQIFLVGAVLGASAVATSDQAPNLYSCFFYFTFAMFTRSAMVPSSGRRTVLLSSIAFVPMIVGGVIIGTRLTHNIDIPGAYFIVGTVVYGVVAVVLAGLCSRVIYGLRKQLEEIEQLGQYSLISKLGEGGMGAVYRARHAMLRRPTALKLLPMSRVGERTIRRFEKEVQLTSELTHPNTIVIYDYGRSPDGVFYYAMEYVDGIDLENLVARYGPQKQARVIHILRQVCGALDEAHNRGLVHRDIKPANVLLGVRGDRGDFVKVVDFGLAVELDANTGISTESIAGTPAYMCPEAVTDPETVGPASDLYGVGCLGYFLLTGKQVFEGKSSVELCVHHARTEPEPVHARTDNLIAAELSACIMRCLEKRPGDRHASAAELAQELDRLTVAHPWNEGEARAFWEQERARKEEGEEGDGIESADTALASNKMTADLSRLVRPMRSDA